MSAYPFAPIIRSSLEPGHRARSLGQRIEAPHRIGRLDTVDRNDRRLPWRRVRDITGISGITAGACSRQAIFPIRSGVRRTGRGVGVQAHGRKGASTVRWRWRPTSSIPTNPSRTGSQKPKAELAEVRADRVEATPAALSMEWPQRRKRQRLFHQTRLISASDLKRPCRASRLRRDLGRLGRKPK